ncbi:nitroreductase [Breoghania sp.]|uniref:nitroreductase n=1 Tax=Breoghania sp. TaxID=2065378 RepID=UPI002AA806D1|nr:nitroreductase [Breoghania sp.]
MTSDAAHLARLLDSRHSCRAFLPDAIPLADLQAMLSEARKAPSSSNLQPGGFHVFTGEALKSFSDALAIHAGAEKPEPPEYAYFPDPMPPFLHERRRGAGYALYAALGIERRDIARRKEQFAANYRFFDAPVGMVVTIRRDMGAGCYLDLGMMVMALMLGAEERGVATCAIGAFSNYARFIHAHLGLPEDELVVCGLAMGKRDGDHPVNLFRTERAGLADYASFHGFEPGEAE